MKKSTLIVLAVAISFCSGFAANTIIANQFKKQIKMKKVTGIGGIFFKCKDPEKMKEWYNNHLGIDAGKYGATFEWRQAEDPTKKGTTAWNPFSEKTKYFDPS